LQLPLLNTAHYFSLAGDAFLQRNGMHFPVSPRTGANACKKEPAPSPRRHGVGWWQLALQDPLGNRMHGG
jgi:hypothetical protein